MFTWYWIPVVLMLAAVIFRNTPLAMIAVYLAYIA